jgi:iron only hydrogenase large subunit-like protein
MPCTAKKYECQRPEMKASGFRDVDYVLTTRELIVMLKTSGIDFANIPDQDADSFMGEYTGAATIFGATGGVMEAALRSAYKLITGKELKNLNVGPVRGMQGIKEAVVPIGSLELRVAVAHGLRNARHLIEEIKAGRAKYHFIEIMACPGGCVGGGGQPLTFDLGLRSLRADGLYTEDSEMPLRRSHENPEVLRLYEDYLIQPLGEKSHRLLHTHYTSRNADTEAEPSGSANKAD